MAEYMEGYSEDIWLKANTEKKSSEEHQLLVRVRNVALGVGAVSLGMLTESSGGMSGDVFTISMATSLIVAAGAEGLRQARG